MSSKWSAPISSSGRLGALGVDEYLKQQKKALQSHLELDDADKKLKWKIYRWAVKARDHHAVAIVLLDGINLKKGIDSMDHSFSIELIFDPQNKTHISLYIYIQPKAEKDARKIQKSNLFYPQMIQNKSLNDILNVSKQCISSWRQYHPIFFNCRHFAIRLMNMLQDETPDPWMQQIGEQLKLLTALGVTMKYVSYKTRLSLIYMLAYTAFDYVRRKMIGSMMAGLARNYYERNGGKNLYRNIGLSLGWFLLIQFGIDKLLKKMNIEQYMKRSTQIIAYFIHLWIYFKFETNFFKQIQVQNSEQIQHIREATDILS